MEVCNTVQKVVAKTIPKKKKCKKAKGLSKETFLAERRRETESKGERERYSQLNAEFQRIARRDKKAFFKEQCKEIEENNRMERLDISSRKVIFHVRMGMIKEETLKT